MSKVIVERPRLGSSRHVPRRIGRLDPARVALTDDEFDPYPNSIGHRRAAKLSGRNKHLNENLAPLRRFLLAQVGRSWDVVWSEISAHLKVTSTVQQHVRDHVKDFVAIKTFIRDGVVYADGWSGPRPLAEIGRSWMQLYVDPVTRVLHRIPDHQTSAQKRRAALAAKTAVEQGWLRRLGPKHLFVLLDDGNWWDVRLANRPRSDANTPAVDVIERSSLSSRPRAERYGLERYQDMHAISKRPLSKAELKRHGLR